MPGLPFAFLTPSLNFVTFVSLRSAVPEHLQLTKYFFQPQVDDLKHEMDEARNLGDAAAQEWYKGLEKAGKDRLSDSVRWEQWEATGGPQRLLNIQTAQNPVTSVPRPGSYNTSTSSNPADAPSPDAHPKPKPQGNGLVLTMATNFLPPAPGKQNYI